MKHQKVFTIIELLVVVVFVAVVGAWGWNAVKLASCDFHSDYRCEIIHGAGLVIPPLSLGTVWFADDDS